MSCWTRLTAFSEIYDFVKNVWFLHSISMELARTVKIPKQVRNDGKVIKENLDYFASLVMTSKGWHVTLTIQLQYCCVKGSIVGWAYYAWTVKIPKQVRNDVLALVVLNSFDCFFRNLWLREKCLVFPQDLDGFYKSYHVFIFQYRFYWKSQVVKNKKQNLIKSSQKKHTKFLLALLIVL